MSDPSIVDRGRSSIPSVDRLLNHADLRALVATHGRVRVRDALREELESWRRRPEALDRTPEPAALAGAIAADLRRADAPSLRPVANLTGTVLHTNLGRALLPEEAIDAMARVAREPCNLEFDLDGGGRGERDAHVERLLVRLTGAESALVVNNNAAAVLLVLNTFAARRSVVVSRGELVEIGGHFRIPDIMARAGARLREVGTTNRTHLRDYADAIDGRTAMLLKVHASNYEIRGFTCAVPEAELAKLARSKGIPFAADLGSGTLVDLRRFGLPHEPTASEMIESGVDLVTFSGDKLLGGPQCGLVVGRAPLVDKLRRNPLKRALRVDKLTLAALEQVLLLYQDPERLATRLPTLRVITRPRSEVRRMAECIAQVLRGYVGDAFGVEVVDCESQFGSGALPVAGLASAGVRVESRAPRKQRSAAVKRLHEALRRAPLPIIGRVADGTLLLDCRCVEYAEPLVAALAQVNWTDPESSGSKA
jgi:L-seryl-tRNA(Ser) seleniumtransferase